MPDETGRDQDSAAEDVARVAVGSGTLLVGWIVDQALRLGLILLLTRALGPQAWGTYVAALALLLVVMAFSPLGLESGAMLAVSQRRSTGERVLHAARSVHLALLLSLAAGVVLALALSTTAFLQPGWFGPPEVGRAVRLLSPILAVHGVATVAHGALLGGGAVRAATLGLHLVRPGAHLLLAGGALLVWTGLDGLLVATSLSYVAGAVALLGTLALLRPHLSGTDRSRASTGRTLRSLLAVSLPLTLAETLHRLHLSLDVLMLTGLTGDLEAVGVYRVAVTVALVGALPVAAAIVMAKSMVGGLLDRPGHLTRVVQATSRWLLVAVGPVYLALLLVPDVVLWPFGPAYADAAAPLAVLLIGQTVHAALAITTPLLALSAGRWVHVGLGAGALVVNAVLNATLVPTWGLLGAATASAVAIGAWAVLRAIATWRILGVITHDLRGWSLILTGLGLGLLGAWLALGQPLGTRLALAGVGAAAFVGVALLMGSDAIDRDILRSLVARVRPVLGGAR